MALLVKPAVVSKSGEEASFLQNWLVFLHLLYTLVENSHVSCLLAPINFLKKAFYCLRASDSNGVYKNHVRQNGR